MMINPSIFREYDIRGIADEDLSEAFAEQLGLAYATELKHLKGNKALTVSVGRDCRLTGDRYATALREGLLKGGLNVVDIGVCPTPLTYFSMFHLDLDGAIMVTGSHNPAEYNGFKIGRDRTTIHGEAIQKLRSLMEKDLPLAPTRGEFSQYEIIPPYLKEIASQIKPSRRLKVILDAGNGTAATVAPPLFEMLGADVIPLYCTLDGNFPNHHPDPTVVSNLKDLIQAVKDHKADIGLAFDGDSDRIGLVDETGRVVFGDEILVVLARAVLKQNPGATIISEVKSSHRLYQDIEKHGGKGIMWKTGHSLIKSKMKETGALLAGEMSGHIFFADRYYGYDDAIYAAARLYEIVSQSELPMSSFLSDLPKSYSTPEIRIDCVEELKFPLVEWVRSAFEKEHQVNSIDGVRVDFNDGWGLLRASNTQPVLVLRFEATTESRMFEIQNQFEAQLRKAQSALGHPELRMD